MKNATVDYIDENKVRGNTSPCLYTIKRNKSASFFLLINLLSEEEFIC